MESREPNSTPWIGTIGISCIRSFERLIAILSDRDSLWDGETSLSVAQDELGRFRVWAGNIGGLQQGSKSSSLDYRLREAPQVKGQVMRLLDDLNDSLHECEYKLYTMSSNI